MTDRNRARRFRHATASHASAVASLLHPVRHYRRLYAGRPPTVTAGTRRRRSGAGILARLAWPLSRRANQIGALKHVARDVVGHVEQRGIAVGCAEKLQAKRQA